MEENNITLNENSIIYGSVDVSKYAPIDFLECIPVENSIASQKPDLYNENMRFVIDPKFVDFSTNTYTQTNINHNKITLQIPYPYDKFANNEFADN